jgi:hypothetical protein
MIGSLQLAGNDARSRCVANPFSATDNSYSAFVSLASTAKTSACNIMFCASYSVATRLASSRVLTPSRVVDSRLGRHKLEVRTSDFGHNLLTFRARVFLPVDGYIPNAPFGSVKSNLPQQFATECRELKVGQPSAANCSHTEVVFLCFQHLVLNKTIVSKRDGDRFVESKNRGVWRSLFGQQFDR